MIDKLPLNICSWDCPNCGIQDINCDINAEKNILAGGDCLWSGAFKQDAEISKLRLGMARFLHHSSCSSHSPLSLELFGRGLEPILLVNALLYLLSNHQHENLRDYLLNNKS